MFRTSSDAVVVGAGPNGLTAAIVLARAGLSVVVLEGQPRIGGGCRTEALTLPGFAHDVCAAIHPMGIVSPVFSRLPLAEHGLSWAEAQERAAREAGRKRRILLANLFRCSRPTFLHGISQAPLCSKKLYTG